MTYPIESQETITSFEDFFENNGAGNSTVTNAFGDFSVLNFDATNAVSRSSGVDIDDLVASFSKDAEAVEAISEGRKWVADQYYQGQETLKALRIQKGLSQKQLADLMSSQQSHVSRLEKGTEDVRLSTMIKLAEVLNENLDAIVRVMRKP